MGNVTLPKILKLLLRTNRRECFSALKLQGILHDAKKGALEIKIAGFYLLKKCQVYNQYSGIGG